MFICVDPGITHCGVSLAEGTTSKFNVIETINVKGNIKLRGNHGEVGEKYGPRSGKVVRIVDAVKDLLERYPDVDMIICEAPFHNRKSPTAFASLLDVVYGIKYMVALDRNIDLTVIAPMAVKKIWSGKGNAGGKLMYDSMVKHVDDKRVVLPEGMVVDDLTEHQIDSIAVGYSYLTIQEEKNYELLKKNV